MELLVGLIVGTVVGFFIGKKYQEDAVIEANRERWRQYASAKKARKAASRGR